jgi:hypothetical protein
MDINETLAQREKTYGSFKSHAVIAQALKKVMAETPNWPSLKDDMREALEMVQHKIARILNGDPKYPDSWHDIAGYVKLVEDELLKAMPVVLSKETCLDTVQRATLPYKVYPLHILEQLTIKEREYTLLKNRVPAGKLLVGKLYLAIADNVRRFVVVKVKDTSYTVKLVKPQESHGDYYERVIPMDELDFLFSTLVMAGTDIYEL